MIQATQLSKSFLKKGSRRDKVVAVSDVTLCAEDGQITGLLGANGAGKSTTLRMLTGLLTPDSGSATVDGWDIRHNKLQVRQSMGYLPHNAGIYPRLTARENIRYFGELSGMARPALDLRVEDLIEQLDMHSIAERRTEGFSQGQKTKVALARALVHRPNNLVLDEPTNGLDVIATRKLRKILRDLRDQGHCILVSSHIMQDITLLCDKVAIIHQGQVIVENSISGLLHATGQTDFEDAFVAAIGGDVEDA